MPRSRRFIAACSMQSTTVRAECVESAAQRAIRFVPSMYLEAALRSIDHSYRYEGYSAFRAEDLHIEGKKIEQSPFHSQSR